MGQKVAILESGKETTACVKFFSLECAINITVVTSHQVIQGFWEEGFNAIVQNTFLKAHNLCLSAPHKINIRHKQLVEGQIRTFCEKVNTFNRGLNTKILKNVLYKINMFKQPWLSLHRWVMLSPPSACRCQKVNIQNRAVQLFAGKQERNKIQRFSVEISHKRLHVAACWSTTGTANIAMDLSCIKVLFATNYNQKHRYYSREFDSIFLFYMVKLQHDLDRKLNFHIHKCKFHVGG